MNEPVISPWIFYALSIVDNLKGCLMVALIFCVLIIIFAPILVEEGCSKKHIKGVFVIAFISVLLLIFVPSSHTITQMVIAQHVTVHNIEKAGELTDRAVDKIIEKIIKISTELNKKGITNG